MKWLHISDIHFKNLGYDTEKLRSSLLEKLKDLHLKLDFILVTGDCFYKNEANEDIVKDLKGFLKKIGRTCGITNNRIYICPGNHDVSRDTIKRNELIEDCRNSSKTSEEIDAIFDELETLGHERFQMLYMKLKGSAKSYKSYRVAEPSDLPARIVIIDTTLFSKDNEDYQKLRVCNSKLSSIEKKLKNDSKLNIVMMHHGLEWLQPDDARKFEHWIEDHHIDAVFCGHTHRAAIYTLNDVNRNILQFTSGALLFDKYAYPSFYLCEGDYSKISLSLYTFSKDTEKWSLDTVHLRKFSSGRFNYKLTRFDVSENGCRAEGKNEGNEDISEANQEKNSLNLGSMACDSVIKELNDRYLKKFDSLKIFSNRAGEKEDFNAWKIVNSLAKVGIPYSVSLRLTCEAVKFITSDEFSSQNILESSQIREIVYHTIIHSKAYLTDLNEYDIGIWATKYAKYYNRESGILLIDDGRKTPITYALLKTSIMKMVVVDITGNELYYDKIYSNEKGKMTNQVMNFIKSLGIFEIRKDVLAELIEEYVTERPHPWFVSGDKGKMIEYNISHADKHLAELKKSSDYIHPILQIEAAYHLCAAILANYDLYIGCTEISPIYILKHALRYKSIQNDRNLPVFRHQLSQLEKDIESSKYSFIDLQTEIENVYKNIITNKVVTNAETTKALIKIRSIIAESIETNVTIHNTSQTVFEEVYNMFISGTGFVVKRPLKQFEKKAFYIKPYWKMEEKENYNLGEDMFVCMLTGSNESGNQIKNGQYATSKTMHLILEYFSQQKKQIIRDIVLFKDDLTDFTADERKKIRELFKKAKLHKRCVFIQNKDFEYVRSKGWREELLRVIISSRYSF